MKKLLALVLALVMTLSLCVTSNAAFAGEDINYDEAVEVMAKLGILVGDETGKFNPKDTLTREQAAKLALNVSDDGAVVVILYSLTK